MRKVETPARQALLAGDLGRSVADILRQAFQLGLVGDFQGEGVGGVEHVLAVFQLQQRELLLQGGIGLLVLGAEQGAATREAFVALLQQLALVGRQVERVPAVVHGLDARKERLVERDVHLVLRQFRGDLLGHLLHRVIAFRLQKVEEKAADAVQRRTGQFQRLDRIGEGRHLGVGGDGVRLGLALGDGGPERGQPVLRADRVETRRPERQGGRNQQRIIHDTKVTIFKQL